VISGTSPLITTTVVSGSMLRAIAAGDAKRFQTVPGVGKRTSERVIVELRDKVAGELEEGVPAIGDGGGDDPHTLARDGLVHLGYTLAEAEQLLAGAKGETPEELIGSALRSAGTREVA